MVRDMVYRPFRDPETLYTCNPAVLSEGNQFSGLPMLMSFTGFSDAGQVSLQVGSELLGQLEAEPVAIFDVDQLVDYRSRRPPITFAQDHLSDYRQPQLVLYRMRDALSRPFLFLGGNEPDLQWERFAGAVVGLVERLDVRLVAWVNAIAMPVPHTRPLGVTVHGNRKDLIEGISTWRTTAQVPSGVGHLLEFRLAQAQRAVAGYAIHVPHYLAESEYPPAAVAALEHLGAAAALMLPSERLRESGREVEKQIAGQVKTSPEVQRVVARLEEQYDERHTVPPGRSLLMGANDQVPDAETIAADIEAYLATQVREQSDGNDPSATDPT